MAKQKEAWDKLSMREKAQLIKLSVGSGISDINTIRGTYNLYSSGGNLAHKYDGNTEDNQFVAVDAKVPKWGAYAPNGPHWGLEGVSGMNGKRYLHYREKLNFYVNEDGTVRAYGYESLPIVNRYGTNYIEIPATGKDSTSTWRTNSWGDTHTVLNFHRIPVGKTTQYTPPPPPIPQDTTITVVPPPVPIDTIIPTPAPPPTSIDTVIPKPKPEPKPKPKPKTEPKPEPEPEPWPSIDVTGLEKDNTNIYTREATQPIYMEGSAPVQNNLLTFDNVEDFMSYYGLANGGNLNHKKSTGGPLYPFSFEKNPFLKTPVVRYDEGGHLFGFGDWLKNIFKPSTDKQENISNQNNLNYTSKVAEGEEIIWQNLPDTIILNNGINSGNVFDVARYAISGKKLDVPDTRFAWDLFSRDGFDNIYKVDKENKIFISLDPILYEKSVKPKLDYIGGSNEDTRSKTAYMINAYPIIQDIANKYNISPNLLFERFAHEGILDAFAEKYNNEYNAEKQRQVKKDPSIFWNTNYSAYNNMGLDTVLKHYINGDLKILDDSVNTFFKLLTKTNNYTKTLNEKGTESLDFLATPENMLHLQAAYFKFLKDKYQKDIEKGSYGNIDIDTFLNAAYNLGQYHKDLKSTKWVTDNYSVKNWYNN